MSAKLGYIGMLTGGGGAPVDPLLDRIRDGTQAAELFTRTNGVNEFELVYESGDYYLFCHDFGTGNIIKVRKASTLAGLSSATEVSTGVTGAYPSVHFDGTTWHLFVYDAGGNTYRFTASTGDATSWTNAQTVMTGGSAYDLHVRQNPADGTFWAAYKESSGTRRAGIRTSPTIGGTWTDRGFIFSTIGRAPWHAQEEADGIPIFVNGEVYVAFAAWDSIRQRVSLVKIDPATFKAIGRPVAIVEPLLSWQQRGSSFKVFNPVNCVGDPAGDSRIYFSHNPSASGVTTGWAYIDPATPPADGRTDDHLVLANFEAAQKDKSTGITANVWGAATYSGTPPAAYLDTASTGATDGGAYGWLNQTDIDGDFTATIEFEVTTVPGSAAFNRLFRIGTTSANGNPIAAMWILGTGSSQFRLYYEVRNAANSVSATGNGSTTTLVANTRYRATLQRSGNTVTLYLAGASQGSGAFSSTLTGAVEWAVANKDGSGGDTNDTQDLRGRVYKFEVVNAVVTP